MCRRPMPPETYRPCRRTPGPGPCRSREPCQACRSDRLGASDQRSKELYAQRSPRAVDENDQTQTRLLTHQPPEPDKTPSSRNASIRSEIQLVCLCLARPANNFPHLRPVDLQEDGFGIRRRPCGHTLLRQSEQKQVFNPRENDSTGKRGDGPCAFAKSRDSEPGIDPGVCGES